MARGGRIRVELSQEQLDQLMAAITGIRARLEALEALAADVREEINDLWKEVR